MAFQIHTSRLTVEEKIEAYIRANDDEPYESGPYALRTLYEFIIDGVAGNKFDDPAAVCEHVRRRLREYMERD